MAENSEEILVFDDLVKEFCEVTQCTDEMGTFFIKRNNLTLQAALNDFFENGAKAFQDQKTSTASSKDLADSDLHPTMKDQSKSFGNDDADLKMITWNIDGLDETDLKLRTLAVTFQINSLQPDVVYLQEVVEETLQLIQRMCKGYTVYHHVRAGYFCAILLRKTPELQFVSKKILEYPGSIMGRYLLCINITYNGCPILLMNTHLESTKDAATQRKVQLKRCFNEIEAAAQDHDVILAGDLNIRDAEIKSIGGLPQGVLDAWAETGSDYATEFTWDVGENDNLNWPYRNKPKLRFDRIFYKSSVNRKMQAKSFDLIGKDRLESCGRFASDHWGINCEFSLMNGRDV